MWIIIIILIINLNPGKILDNGHFEVQNSSQATPCLIRIIFISCICNELTLSRLSDSCREFFLINYLCFNEQQDSNISGLRKSVVLNYLEVLSFFLCRHRILLCGGCIIQHDSRRSKKSFIKIQKVFWATMRRSHLSISPNYPILRRVLRSP